MIKPPRELVDAFLHWYENDPHATYEDFYEGKLSKKILEGFSREQFIQFFFQFARDGGKVQSGGYRTAPLLKQTMEEKYEDFRGFMLEPFADGFDEENWVDRLDSFKGLGRGIGTIYLNRVDKKRFAILNNKAIGAVRLLGVAVPSSRVGAYTAVRDAEKQLIEWFPAFENLFRTDALTHFLIGTDEGRDLAAKIGLGPTDGVRHWIYAPGKSAHYWDQYYNEGVMGIGWDKIKRDLKEFQSEEDLRIAYDEAYGDEATDVDFGQLREFLYGMREGDHVWVKKGMKEIVGYGRVASDYYYEGKRPAYRHLRKAKWEKKGSWLLPDDVTSLPVKTLTEAKNPGQVRFFQGLVGIGPDSQPYFGRKAFELISKLEAKPKASVYEEHKEEFEKEIEAPFRRLMKELAEGLPSEMADALETQKKLFSRFRKNDFGQGGAWPHYWAAFYPSGGKRQTDAQLFVIIKLKKLRFGFGLGSEGGPPKDRFALNCKNHAEELKELLSPAFWEANLTFGTGDVAATQKPSFEQWLDDPEGLGVEAAIELPEDEVVSLSGEALASRIRDMFRRLFPLMLLASQDEPMEAVRDLLGEDDGGEGDVEKPEYSLQTFASETFLPLQQIERWIRAVRRKRQAIFYGPPGTGKTFVAQRVARHLIGGSQGFTECLQFHPSYAYEDFMQGLRPKALKDGGLEYAMVPGRFKDFCARASKVSDPCVLVLDEINRANLSRVFGELMFLLEYRNEKVPLAGGELFRIPENVYIVGTMNTADRSIALVDHALRRRFAFLVLNPEDGVLRGFHEDTGFDPEGLIGVLGRLNTTINDRHYSVGVSFFLDQQITDRIQDVWQMEIEPYIEELFFDQPDKTDAFRWDKVEKEILGE